MRQDNRDSIVLVGNALDHLGLVRVLTERVIARIERSYLQFDEDGLISVRDLQYVVALHTGGDEMGDAVCDYLGVFYAQVSRFKKHGSSSLEIHQS